MNSLLLYINYLFILFLQRDGKNYYYRPDHINYLNSNPGNYGFPERREAEGSEDFDAMTHDNVYQRDHKSPSVAAFPQFPSPAGQPSGNLGKNVRFEAFSSPTSPYNLHSPVQYKSPNRYGQRNSEEVRWLCIVWILDLIFCSSDFWQFLKFAFTLSFFEPVSNNVIFEARKFQNFVENCCSLVLNLTK